MIHLAERFSFFDGSIEAPARLRLWSGKATSINAKGDTKSAFSKASLRGAVAGMKQWRWVNDPENFDLAYRMLIKHPGNKNKRFWFFAQEEDDRPYYVILDGDTFTGCFGNPDYLWNPKRDRVVLAD